MMLLVSAAGQGAIEVNKEFEITKISDFADDSLSSWVHHVSYILPQVGGANTCNIIQRKRYQ